MTAKQLLKETDTPIGIAFRNHLHGAEATRRKAAEFLRGFGDKYGVRMSRELIESRKPIRVPMSLDGSTAAINCILAGGR
jgi:hypothetical protein